MAQQVYGKAWAAPAGVAVNGSGFQYAWASLRIVLGSIFLWAFFDKLLGLGFATKPESAWVNGGSPTLGFLKFGTAGPLAGFYQGIAGHPVVDVLFMAGLLGIGAALVLGIGNRIAGYSGALMMMLMWSANLPPANNPLVDDHVVYALVLIGFALADPAKQVLGFGRAWASRPLVREHPVLQ